MPRLQGIFDRDLLSEDKRHVFDYLVETRGSVTEGFGVLLHNPEVAHRVAHIGTYIRFESSLPAIIRELAAFTTSAELGNDYERTIHAAALQNLGVGQKTLDAVNSKGSLEGLPDEDVFAITCARELVLDHKLSEPTFQRALKSFGEAGVIDLIATVGYYAMLAFLHSSLEVKPPSR